MNYVADLSAAKSDTCSKLYNPHIFEGTHLVSFERAVGLQMVFVKAGLANYKIRIHGLNNELRTAHV